MRVILLSLCLFVSAAKAQIPLDGIWKFRLDPVNVSIPIKGSNFVSQFPENVVLPGSLDENGKGYRTQGMTSIRLTRLFEYQGAAWFEKDNVFIPAEWADKEVFALFERVHWESRLWVNGSEAGSDESLSTPHVYRITPFMRAGENNTLRLRIDNSLIYDIAYTHAISAETQTNWNGVVGKMQLFARDKVHIQDVQVFPDRKHKKVTVEATVANFSGSAAEGAVTLRVTMPRPLPLRSFAFQGADSLIRLKCEYPLGDTLFLWDEFTPDVYSLDCTLSAAAYSDMRTVRFGVRDFTAKGTQFAVNDRITFIRGTVNCAEFPLTGYPPTDRERWLKVLGACRDYGLNCVRFHSWCPPEAAFEVADSLGLYLQVENPDWRFTVGDDEPTNQFYMREAKRIFDTFGNHPSFVFFCEGNELAGKGRFEFLAKALEQWKQDPRHLYVAASGYPNVEGSDFYDFYGARPQRWQEGMKGRFNAQPLNTLYDYSDYVKQHKIPMITHEIGQWCAYPDLREVTKYTGVLKPYNYELFREDLRNKHLLEQAEEFMMASGKFQVIQKKEEFESYFRTPGFGGYHLLQLNDFPGQGTSPVGVTDVFYDPKPYVTAEEFRRLQQPLMPLLRTAKFCYTEGETLAADAQIANFGRTAIDKGTVRWALLLNNDSVVAEGRFANVRAPLGKLTSVGKIKYLLSDIKRSMALRLRLSVEGTDIYNSWQFWVYPAADKLDCPLSLSSLPLTFDSILITDKWDGATQRYLEEQGGKVFLLADTAQVNSDVLPCFSGISWNAVWSGAPPNLLGILCNPAHGAFKDFPTEKHSNWQWFDIVHNSKPMLLDRLPYSFRPLVQMIPDWNNNRRIGLVFEANIGRGKLMMTSVAFRNILSDSPVARQLFYSLLQYMRSPAFAPNTTLPPAMISDILSN